VNLWLAGYAASVTLGLIASAVILNWAHIEFDRNLRMREEQRRRDVDRAFTSGFNAGVNAARTFDSITVQAHPVPRDGFLQ